MLLYQVLVCLLLRTVYARNSSPFQLHDEASMALLGSSNQTMLMPGLGSDLDQTASLFTGLDKRQSCQPGYGFCDRWNICCPDGAGAQCCQASATCVTQGQECCSAEAGVDACDVGQKCCVGGCAPADSTCCSGGRYCDGQFPQCCQGGGCVPDGAQCCDGFFADGRRKYCEAGNSCYAFDDSPNDIFCCTNSACTARVEGGTSITVTSSIPTSTQLARTTEIARTTQITRTVYYNFTCTWYYYRYFFAIYQQASAVTSTIRTTTTTFSVQATNSAEASSLASVQFVTITATPPADASTQLATYSRLASATPSEGPLPTAVVGGGGGDGDNAVMGPSATQAVGGGQVAAASARVCFSGALLFGAGLVIAVVLCG
ncbi:hypothetical protein CLAFUW4_12077 [Fulvia fulva]|uniref:GPI anchored protein n=1 Tax=Passalora fulva TaxID=5499 RepID=A0A9Q8UST0_PASFU|nr:uncharacterized protein CLAFUR5_11116 [Fulvia fulva]KAK4618007.1 hypothetical protein CLAFUR4_12082 [Fulvia fulva]KAK4619239.1 hypothetical protein CLAFUR0_12093 [Fulvia fulva]UJO21116.1 hypothetical protein CLAFUR5_11116 [Fulvia fulva]WPV17942.1 hypothetical protein CLAFUW4_12077 [Fulvia fulva]WPV32988.1 hypothetical protein CLAFUW7_12084 [Fulvia fulva]